LKDIRNYIEQNKQLILQTLKSTRAWTSPPRLMIQGCSSQPGTRSASGGAPFWPEIFKCHSLYYVHIRLKGTNIDFFFTLTEELEQTWHLNDKRTRLEFGEPDGKRPI